MKKNAINLLLGVVSTLLVMALLLYMFFFVNPFGIYEPNKLKWIPVLITAAGFLISGWINRETPWKWLPLLLLPLVAFKPFNFLYFPFFWILILTAILALVSMRKDLSAPYKKLSGIALLGIGIFFLFNQPLLMEGNNADDTREVWNFTEKTRLILPDHVLTNKNNTDFNLSELKGKTYFITFWATWCAPCLKEKPELDKLKERLKEHPDIRFVDISFDTDQNKWKQFIENKSPSGMQLISKDQQKTSRALDFAGLPMHFVVNEKGVYTKYKTLDEARKKILQYEVP